MTKSAHTKAFLAATLTALSLGVSVVHAENNVNIKLAYAQNSQPVKDALSKFGSLVEEKSGGSISVTYFPDSQLGGESELVELLQTGAIDMTKVSGGLMGSFSPLYSVFSMPYLFDGEKHFHDVMNNPDIMDDVYQSTKGQGFVGVGWYDSGQRNFYTTDEPINEVSDLEGKKIRVMQSEKAVNTMKLLGASPVVMSQEEVYTALQQGILDGAENNEFALTTARHGEVVNYYTLDGHTRIPDIILFNNNTLSSLTEPQREAVMSAIDESTQFQLEQWSQSVEEARKSIKNDFNVEINAVNISPFQDAVQPIYDDLKSHPEQYSLYQKIKNTSSNQ
ncbi:TRAP transporter substrate-binding protein [Halomonas eurihalina]|uniref:TRAP transporter substrate-binding protein n=1 Tax=Halomonas eurihalina TaxID=42566 RepID=A0A5D9CSF7_HALER|nr:TRAP transporter substrate-binding protein [Halomonas eurihalina]MDR5860382.1 TRAP transporter substrate-binding protein [Halomonas eurihalina]TZG33942.1 TRAP transporter substrate-binding protein [Halomonas eurihalina]